MNTVSLPQARRHPSARSRTRPTSLNGSASRPSSARAEWVRKPSRACKEHGCVYLHAIGGAAQIYAQAIQRVLSVRLEEFGSPEAVWELEVRNFPAVVTIDAHGNSLHRVVQDRSQELLGCDAVAACGRTLWGRVTAKRHRILGDEDETMLFHCEESTTTKTVPFRRNPPGAWGFGPRALSFVGYDETASCPPLFAPATRRPVRAAPQGSATGC